MLHGLKYYKMNLNLNKILSKTFSGV